MNMDLNVGSLDQIRFINANGLNNSFFALNGVSTFNVSNITPGSIVNAGTYTILDYAGTVALLTRATSRSVRSPDSPPTAWL
jgi:hypothetical protein